MRCISQELEIIELDCPGWERKDEMVMNYIENGYYKDLEDGLVAKQFHAERVFVCLPQAAWRRRKVTTKCSRSICVLMIARSH